MRQCKKVLIDFEEAFNSFTGIPLSTINDALCIIKSGSEVILWYRDKRKTEKIKEWINSFFNEAERERVHLLRTRPSNLAMWIAQLSPIFLKTNIPCDFAYSRLFPKLPVDGIGINLLRIDDAFGSHDQVLKSFIMDIRSGMNIKHSLARAFRTFGYSRMGLKRTIRIFNSGFTKNAWRKTYIQPNLKDYVVYPPVQFSIEDAYLTKHKVIKSKNVAHYFVFIGGQRQRKDPVAIIEAWATNIHQYNFDLVVVGSIEEDFFSSKMKFAYTHERLRITKNIPSEQLRELIESSQGIIFNSKGEGFGNPIAEGMYLGVPVICNNLEVFEEVGKGYAHFFKSGDYSQAIDILQKIAAGKTALRHERNSNYAVESIIKIWKQILDPEYFDEKCFEV